MRKVKIKGILLGIFLFFLMSCNLYAADRDSENTSVVTLTPASSPEVTQTPSPSPEVTQIPTPTPQPVIKKGLIKEGKYYYYYYKGKRQKNVWKKIDGYRYYFTEKGTAAVTCINLNGKAYVFDRKGHLIQPSKKKIVKSGDNYFYINTNGQAQTGWFRIGNRLYRADSKGRMYKNRTYQDVVFGSNCAAKSNTASKLKLKTMEVVESVTNSKMTDFQKLYACWKYLVNSGRFRYRSFSPDIYKAGWQKECALDMLTRYSGSCSSFACAFAALASEIGYDPYVISGRVPGSRDQAADGMTRHCWVRINGRHYDPEGVYAGWSGYIYGNSSYPIYHTVRQIINFKTGKK